MKEKLTRAHELILSDPEGISGELQQEVKQHLAEVDKKIQYYETESRTRLIQAQENMNNLRFERVDQEVVAFQKELAQVGLESLKQSFIPIINTNNKNLSLQKNLKALMSTFNQGDVPRTYTILQDIYRLISNPMLNSEFIPDLLNATNTSYQRVKDQLTQAEDQFKTEIEGLEKQITESVNFETLRSQFQEKLKIAEQRGYSPMLSPMQAFIVRIDENQQILTEIERIKAIAAEGKLHKAHQEFEASLKRFTPILRNLFPPITNMVDSKRKELELKLSTIKERLQTDLHAIQDKLDATQDYEPVKQELLNFKIQSEDAELMEYAQKADELLERIRFNVRVYLEISKIKKLLESGNISEAVTQFEQIKENVNKKAQDCFRKNFESIDSLKNEIHTRQEQIKDEIIQDIEQYKKSLAEQLNFETLTKQIEGFQQRARLANLQAVPEQIGKLEQIGKKNDQLFEQLKSIQANYTSENYTAIKDEIQKLIKAVNSDKDLYFPKIEKTIVDFEQKLNRDAESTQNTIQSNLDQILNTEIKDLKFIDAQEKIHVLKKSAEKFGLVSLQDQMNKITDKLSTHIQLNAKFNQILALQQKTELGSAKKLIDELDNEIQPKFDLLYPAFREKIDQTRNTLQADITKEYNAISETVRPLTPLVETEKKYTEAVEPLKTLKIRADKIGVQILSDQINELIKKCNMYLMPTGGMFIPRKITRSSEMGMSESAENKVVVASVPKEQPKEPPKPTTPVKSTSSLASRTPVGPIRCKNCGCTQPANSRICTICGHALK